MGVSTLWIPATEPFDGGLCSASWRRGRWRVLEEVTGGSYRRSVSLKNGAGVVSVRPEARRRACGAGSRRPGRRRRGGRAGAPPVRPGRRPGRDRRRCSGPTRCSRRSCGSGPGLRLPGAWTASSWRSGRSWASRCRWRARGRCSAGWWEVRRMTGRRAALPGRDVLAEADPGVLPVPARAGSRPRRGRETGRRRASSARTRRLTRMRPAPGSSQFPASGPGRSSYIAMRALGDRDVFLPGDVGDPARARRGSAATPIRTAGAPGAPTRSCICGAASAAEIRSRAMRAVQIAELSGPESALERVDLPEPEPSHPLTPGSGVVIDVHAAGVSFPEVLQTRGEYQIKPDAAVRARQRGGRRRAQRAGGLRAQRGRPRGGAAACSAASPRSPWRPTSSPSRSPTSSTSPRAPALILNYHTAYFSLKHARAARRGRDRARPRRGRRRRHRDAPGGEGPRRAHDRRRLERREGARRARGGRRRGRALRRRLEGRGQGAVGRRRRHRASTRSAATASPTACARCARTAGSWSSASPAARSPR